MLMVSGGFVLELNPKDTSSHQILPPRVGEVPQGQGDDEGGSAGQFSLLYNQFGDSFRTAKWCFGKQAVAAVMRSDRGEVLIVQPLPQGTEVPPHPIPIVTAEKIDLDISPVDGTIIFSATNVPMTKKEKEAFRKAGGGLPPTRHAVGYIKEDNPSAPKFIVRSPSDNFVFSSPRISPDGERVIVSAGTFDAKTGTTSIKALLSYPFSEEPPPPDREHPEIPAHPEATLVQGDASNPSWSPDGKQIAYIKKSPGGKRAIFVINFDGTGEHSVTGESGDYAMPTFSPQRSQPAK